MYPTNAYLIRRAVGADSHALSALADLDSARPLSGPALIGEVDGKPAAAIALVDGRVVADPFQRTAVLTQLLRMRRGALRAHASTPSLRDRVRAAMTPFRERTATS